MSDIIRCPNCGSDVTYPNQDMMVCTQCFHEWVPVEQKTEVEVAEKVIDANGVELQNGDSVVLIKDLPVKGAPKPLKAGTKVRNIRLSEGDHNISCKIDGYGA